MGIRLRNAKIGRIEVAYASFSHSSTAPPTCRRPARTARRAIRNGQWTGPTSGLAPGYVQGNLAILPEALAADFLRFCQLNPKPCPLLGAVARRAIWRAADARRGSRHPHRPAALQGLARTANWSTSRTTSRGYWRDDLVIFVLGCSFSFEEALIEDGIELRHITNGCTVPMYRTSIETAPAGPFHGPMVVSMRPMKPADAIRAVQITTRFPVRARRAGASRQARADRHQGHRRSRTMAMPCRCRDDEMPVFWACGVTPQSVVATVKPEFCITHYPGCMLVTDRRNSEFAIM